MSSADFEIHRSNYTDYYEKKAERREDEKRKATQELNNLNRVYNDMKREIEKRL